MKAKLNSFYEITEVFSDDMKCREYLEKARWGGEIGCPHCGGLEKIYKFSDGKRYKCGDCRKQFTVTVGTIFEGSHVPLKKWFWAIYLFSSHKKGISSIQLSKDIGVQQKTAWFMLQRIRFMMNDSKFWKPLEKTVEIDETMIGGKTTNKHKSKRLKGTQGRNTKDKTAVLGILERGGDVRLAIVPNVQTNTLKPIIDANVKPGAKIMTDEYQGYKILAKDYIHKKVNHNDGEYANGDVHVNTLEGFWSLLKRGIIGIYHQTSPKHLHRYCHEFAFRYKFRTFTEIDRFRLTLSRCDGRLTYKNLIGNGKEETNT